MYSDFNQEQPIKGVYGKLFGINLFLKKLFHHPLSAVGTSIFIILLLLAFIGPVLARYSPTEQIYTETRQPPSETHLFGTDILGRDIFSRVIGGTRDLFLISGLGTLLSVIIGTAIGLLSGYYGGWFDEIIMRLFDSLLSIPALLLSLLMLGTIGPSRLGIIIVLVIVYPPIVARVVRSVVLGEKNKSYIASARTQGEKTGFILFRLILPSVYPALAVEASLRFSYAIFLTASLGFLGVGVQPPNPDWGLMVKEARNSFSQVPWAMYFPTAFIALTVISTNLMADGLKKALLNED